MKKLGVLLMLVLPMTISNHYILGQEITITLNPGWNWISYPKAEEMDITTALGGFIPVQGDIIKSKSDGTTTYNGTVWRGSLTQFTPGLGYHYFSNRTEIVSFVFGAEPIVPCTPVGAINGKFTINSDGDQVFFSQGNLQYIGSAATPYWKFADNQWDYLGDNGQGSTSQNNIDRDLFGWGTSGYNHGAIAYQPWSTSSDFRQYYAYGASDYNLCDQTGQADWGYNAIFNGGNLENMGWRTLTSAEWVYIFNTRAASIVNGESSARYTKANVSGYNGVILFPDFYTHPDGVAQPMGINNSSIDYENNYTESDFALMEANGAVFLPAAGSRYSHSLSLYNVNILGYYWSSSHFVGYSEYTNQLYFSPSGVYPSYGYPRYNGCSVRLVRNAE